VQKKPENAKATPRSANSRSKSPLKDTPKPSSAKSDLKVVGVSMIKTQQVTPPAKKRDVKAESKLAEKLAKVVKA